jgi:CDGSH-type Zn-finger protein
MHEQRTGERVIEEESGTVSIVPYRDGPYVVRGDFQLLDQEGAEIPLGRRTVALCRCGRSRMRPFCDGTHRLANFRASGGPEGYDGPVRAAVEEPRAALAYQAASSPSTPDVGLGQPDDEAPIDGSPAEVSPLTAPLEHIGLAHRALVACLDAPCRPQEHLAMRMAEPFVRSACALLETRALQPPTTLAPEHLRAGGPDAVTALVAAALTSATELCAECGDTLLETVRALLADAAEVLRGGAAT